MRTRRFCAIISIGLALCVTAAQVGAAITADLDDGNTGVLVDGYRGVPGQGWTDEWKRPTSGGAYTTGPGVVSAAPLSPGGGNYLTATYGVSSANGQTTVSRQWGDYGGVALDQAHTVRFQFRPDDLTGFDHNEDRFFLFDRPGYKAGTDAQCTWIIAAAGDTRGGSNWNALEWTFFDGNKAGGGYYGSNFINTGVPLTAGTTYDVKVDVRPGVQEWDATITDGTNSYSHSGVGFRSAAAQAGGALSFGGRGSAGDDERSFSVDRIRIGETVIQADFTHGNGTTAVDQFRGKAGEGWATEWQVKGNGNVDVTMNIDPPTEVRMPADASFSEVVAGAGAYLDVSMQHKDNPNNGQAAITRPYASYGVVDPTQPHTVQFALRIDEVLGGSGPFASAAWDQYFVFDATGLKHGYSEDSDASWLIMARADAVSRTGKWYLYDGPADGGPVDTSRLIDTGMSLGDGGGDTFHFAVQVDPQAGVYDVAISNEAIGKVWTGLGFQKAAKEVGQYVTFGSRGNRAADHREFSVDLLRIDAPVQRIVADFSDGNGADYVDQFGGRAGNGWVTPWTTTGGSGLTAQVVDTQPLSGNGGRYLSATFQRISSGGQATFNRMYLGDFALSRPQEIRFQYRHDSSLADFGDHDRVVFFEDGRALQSTATSNRWLIFADGGLFDRNWIVYDGNQGGARPGAVGHVDSGVRLEQGHVYTFSILMDPVAGLWDVMIRDETDGSGYNSLLALPDHLGFRTGLPHAGGYLNFGGEIDAGEIMQFSLDSIRIIAVPEPCTAAMLALGAAALGGFLRRRRLR